MAAKENKIAVFFNDSEIELIDKAAAQSALRRATWATAQLLLAAMLAVKNG
jgi:hypothetical protein